MRLIATGKLKYATRHLVAGEEFEASNRDGHLLVAIKKARHLAGELVGHVDPVEVLARADDIGALREKAARLGVKVDKRWGVRRLRDEIEKR